MKSRSGLVRKPMNEPYSDTGLAGIAGDRVSCSSRPHSRAMNKVVAVQLSGGATGQGSGGVSEGRRVKGWLQMRRASQTARSPVAGIAVGMRRVFQQAAGVPRPGGMEWGSG